jgi:hypothetical protein
MIGIRQNSKHSLSVTFYSVTDFFSLSCDPLFRIFQSSRDKAFYSWISFHFLSFKSHESYPNHANSYSFVTKVYYLTFFLIYLEKYLVFWHIKMYVLPGEGQNLCGEHSVLGVSTLGRRISCRSFERKEASHWKLENNAKERSDPNVRNLC